MQHPKLEKTAELQKNTVVCNCFERIRRDTRKKGKKAVKRKYHTGKKVHQNVTNLNF